METRHLVETGDGSHSLYVPALDEQYHSRHGAYNESQHVFIEMGLQAVDPVREPLRILEIGFGTGLNALLTLAATERKIEYIGVEAYPLAWEEAEKLNYPELVGGENAEKWFEWLHQSPWEVPVNASNRPFSLTKHQADFFEFELEGPVDLVYFDAFAPNKQPELWTEAMFQRMADFMAPGAVLTTYCAKGAVRRAMQSVGLEVERLPGPPGKREMLRATQV